MAGTTIQFAKMLLHGLDPRSSDAARAFPSTHRRANFARATDRSFGIAEKYRRTPPAQAACQISACLDGHDQIETSLAAAVHRRCARRPCSPSPAFSGHQERRPRRTAQPGCGSWSAVFGIRVVAILRMVGRDLDHLPRLSPP